MGLQIHPDLQSLIPPLSPEEFALLEANLLADGCLTPLIVWQEEQVVLDGHNRLELCTKHDLSYHVQEISLPDLEAAKAWLISHQVGRRNLNTHQLAYFQGSLYLRLKRQGRRTDLTSDHSEQKSPDTATELGRQFSVSAATIRRNADYAQAVDVIAQAIGPTARAALLDRERHATRDEVERFAVWAQESPEYVEAVRADLDQADSAYAKYRAFFHAVDLTQRGAPRKFCATCGRAKTQADALISQIPVCPGHLPQAAAQDSAPSPPPTPAPVPPHAAPPGEPATTPRQGFRDLVEALAETWNGGAWEQVQTLIAALSDHEGLTTLRWMDKDHGLLFYRIESLYWQEQAAYWQEMATTSMAAIETVIDRLSALTTYEAGEAERQEYVAWLREKGHIEAAPWETDPTWFDNPDIIGFVCDTLETTPHSLALVRQYCATLTPDDAID